MIRGALIGYDFQGSTPTGGFQAIVRTGEGTSYIVFVKRKGKKKIIL